MKSKKILVKQYSRIATKKAARFVSEHKAEIFQLAVMGVVIGLSGDASARSVGGSHDGGITVFTNTIKNVQETVTGPVAKGLVTIGTAAFGASYAMNVDNQAVKSLMRLGGGGSVALGAVDLIPQATGLLF